MTALDRTDARLLVTVEAGQVRLSWGTDHLLIPRAEAEGIARHILGLAAETVPDLSPQMIASGVAKAALAAAKANGSA